MVRVWELYEIVYKCGDILQPPTPSFTLFLCSTLQRCTIRCWLTPPVTACTLPGAPPAQQQQQQPAPLPTEFLCTRCLVQSTTRSCRWVCSVSCHCHWVQHRALTLWCTIKSCRWVGLFSLQFPMHLYIATFPVHSVQKLLFLSTLYMRSKVIDGIGAIVQCLG